MVVTRRSKTATVVKQMVELVVVDDVFLVAYKYAPYRDQSKPMTDKQIDSMRQTLDKAPKMVLAKLQTLTDRHEPALFLYRCKTNRELREIDFDMWKLALAPFACTSLLSAEKYEVVTKLLSAEASERAANACRGARRIDESVNFETRSLTNTEEQFIKQIRLQYAKGNTPTSITARRKSCIVKLEMTSTFAN